MCLCTFSNCSDTAIAVGLCGRHYQRFKRYGDPSVRRKRYGPGWVNSKGYVELLINGERESLHRALWISANGPIPEGFVVHHKNEDKLDNRLENFELKTKGSHSSDHNRDRPPEVKARLTTKGMKFSEEHRAKIANALKRPFNKCSVPECERKVSSYGFCSKHYYRFQKHGDPNKVTPFDHWKGKKHSPETIALMEARAATRIRDIYTGKLLRS